MKTKSLLLMLAVAMVSCGTNNSENKADEQPVADETAALTPDAGAWRLNDFAGKDSITTLGADQNYYLKFNSADHTFGMTTDCNSIGGEYVINGDSLTFQNIATTLMACPDTAVEDGMKDVLSKTDTYVVSQDSILVLRGDARMLATFKYVPVDSIAQ